MSDKVTQIPDGDSSVLEALHNKMRSAETTVQVVQFSPEFGKYLHHLLVELVCNVLGTQTHTSEVARRLYSQVRGMIPSQTMYYIENHGTGGVGWFGTGVGVLMDTVLAGGQPGATIEDVEASGQALRLVMDILEFCGATQAVLDWQAE